MLICAIFTNQILHAQCNHPDYPALMELFIALDGGNWPSNEDWQAGLDGTACNPCDRFGEPWNYIACENDRVVRIRMNGPAAFGELPDIELTELRTLSIFSANLKGEIPDFASLQKLENIELWNSNLEGEIPNFSNLPKLKKLAVSDNELIGSIPDFNNCNQLERIFFQNNKLNGQIPNFSNLPLLKEVNVDGNQLEGRIPDLILNCPHLVTFTAEHNKLTGCYPDFTCAITASFEGNYALPYSGEIATFCEGKPQIGSFCGGIDLFNFGTILSDCSCYFEPCENPSSVYLDLMKFYESTNGDNWTNNYGWKQAVVGIFCEPCEELPLFENWYGINCNALGQLTGIDLDGGDDGALVNREGNNLVGELTELNLPHLRTLILSWNNLSGNIPDVSKYPKLERLGIVNNNLTGEMPTFENNPKLKIFRGTFNQLTGTLPDFDKLPALEIFTAANNQLEGCYSTNICNLDLFHVEDNFALPWFGDHKKYCDGKKTIGASCIIPGTNDEGYIQEDCSCSSNFISSQNELSYDTGISPNPVADELEIEFKNKIKNFGENVSYQIFDAAGVAQQRGYVLANKINVGLLNSGVYILHLSDGFGNNVYVTRFIKL